MKYKAIIEDDCGYRHIVEGRDLGWVRSRALKKAQRLLAKRLCRYVDMLQNMKDKRLLKAFEQAARCLAKTIGFRHDPWGFRSVVKEPGCTEEDKWVTLLPCTDVSDPARGWAICCVIYCLED